MLILKTAHIIRTEPEVPQVLNFIVKAAPHSASTASTHGSRTAKREAKLLQAGGNICTPSFVSGGPLDSSSTHLDINHYE